MTDPLFSICIPTRNRPHTIGRALESCLKQTYTNFEVIVSDNASTLPVEAVVQSYARRDSRIHYFKNQQNLGIAGNIFRVFQLARGEYVQYLADDSWLQENYVEEKLKCFRENREAGLVSSRLEKVKSSPGGLVPVIETSTEIREGRIDSEVAFHDFYRTGGWFGLLCTSRRTDMLEAMSALETIPNPYGYDYFEANLVYDVALYLYILSRYPYIYYTNKTTYFDLMTPSEIENASLSDLIKTSHMIKVAFQYTFELVKKENCSSDYRRYAGAYLLVEAARRLLFGPRAGVGLSSFPRYYRDYGLSDWLSCFAQIGPILFARLAQRFKMTISKNKFLSSLPAVEQTLVP